MRKVLLLLLLPALAMFAYSCESESEGSGDLPEPHISGIVTDYDGKAVSGKPVTIKGVNFSPVVSDNKVYYGVGMDAVSLRVTDASETHIVFIAPKTDQEQLKIRVSVKGKDSNSVTLLFDHAWVDDSGSGEPAVDTEGGNDPVDISALLNASTKVTVREGVEWISFHGTWEGQIRNINIVKTTLNEHNRLGIYYQYGDDDDYITKKCEHLDALVGTNGPMACCHYVRVDGVTKRGANKQDPWITSAALTIDNGVPDIVKVKDNYASAALKNQNIGTGGPLLVYEGRIYEETTSFKNDVLPEWKKNENWENGKFIYTTHPRTAFGISEDQKTVYHVAVDGRWNTGSSDKRATGMQTALLAKLMKGLGCYKALNFDGGGGTAMWIYGKGVNGIVNHPCDSPMNWDNPTLRTCGNAVYIYSDLK